MNNIYLILGGSSDIGLELIQQIEEKCLIIAHYNSNNGKLLELQKKITNELVTIQADLSVDEDIMRLIDVVENEYGIPTKIVQLVAPKFDYIRFKSLEWSDFEKNINVSLKSTMLIFKYLLPKMAKSKEGKIVVMSSSVTKGIPPKFLAHYTTSKYALLGLVKSLASEYGPKKITINAISPSMIETKFLEKIDNKMIELSAHNSPLKRNANVEDVIPAIIFLLSKGSDYMTGNNLLITGGSNF